MFQSTRNIDRAFHHIQIFTACCVLGCAVISVYTISQCMETVKASQSRVYILANGKALAAMASDRKDNIEVEARDHVKTFHELFFTLAPDEKVIQRNMSKAMYLADASAKREYDRLQEKRYFQDIVTGNVSQEISVDSILVNTDSYPYYFRCYATVIITRTTNITTRGMTTQGYLRSISRSDNNPHGFLIEKWETLENDRNPHTETR